MTDYEDVLARRAQAVREMTGKPVNTSGIKPLGCAVLVEHYEPERKDSLIVMPDNIKDRSLMIEQRAVVIEAGPEAWLTEREPRAIPGDKVLMTKMAGYMCEGPADGKKYRLVNDQDIFARITKEKQDE